MKDLTEKISTPHTMNISAHRNRFGFGPGRATGFCGLLLGFLSATAGFGANDYFATAIAARADQSYVRERDNDGNYAREYYTFGEGGRWGGPMTDTSIDKLSFTDVAHLIAPSLRSQNYAPAVDPKKTRLLIMVYWGATDGAVDYSGGMAAQNLSKASEHLRQVTGAGNASQGWGKWVNTFPPGGVGKDGEALRAALDKQAADSEIQAALVANAMANRMRDQQNWRNAGMLGYETEVSAFSDQQFTALRNVHRDAVDEIEDNRYFVVLMAYDFQRLLKKHEHVLLWETRISIRQRGNDFDKSLPAMAGYGSQFYGRDSKGLIRGRKLNERIRLDELKIIGVEPDAK